MYHRKKLIVMEIDNVLAAVDSRLEDVVSLRFGEKWTNAQWAKPLSRRVTDEEVAKEVAEFLRNPNFYYGLEEISEGLDFLEGLLADEHKVVFVSRRPISSLNFTYRWLDGRVSDLNTTMFLGVDNKADFLSNPRWQIDFVVESDPEEIGRLKKAGFTVLCWEQAWNTGIYPRLYTRSDGEIMLWGSDSTESTPFFSEGEE